MSTHFDPGPAVFTRPDPGTGVYTMATNGDVSGQPADLIEPPGRGIRFVAAMGYLGVLGLLISLARPDRRFLRYHSHVALPLHVLRLVWVGGIMAVWWLSRPDNDVSYTGSHLMADVSLLLVAGVPRESALRMDVLPWILTPLVVTWVLSLAGFVIALTGHSADFRAFATANWGDAVRDTTWWRTRAAEERRRARLARERQLERLQRTTESMGVERERRERRAAIEDALQRASAERDHINQLLALGEISRRRYDSLNEEIDDEVASLRSELTEITQRSSPYRKAPEPLRMARLDRAHESDVETIAIVTPSGVPLFTYGYFHLDEALVAGILSAFDSISEEMFGSRVHKTELSEGQVLYFARGEHIVVLAIFTEEPSPKQIEQLRMMAQLFESVNADPLGRLQYDPSLMQEVDIPFRLRERE